MRDTGHTAHSPVSDPRTLEEYLDAGAQALDALDLPAALSAYEAAAAADPASFSAYIGLARTMTRMRRKDGAMEAIERAIALDPDRAEGHALLGALRFLLDETDLAREALETAIERDPNDAEAHLTLAQVHADAGRFDDADIELGRAEELVEAIDDETQRERTRALALHAKTYRFLAAGDSASAMAAAEEVLELEDANPYAACLALSNMGILEARARHYDQAIEYLERAVSMNPYFARAGNALGRLLIIRRQPERAAKVLGQTLQYLPHEEAGAHYAYGMSLARSGKREDALAQYRRALDLGLSGTDRLLARWQTVWLNEWGRYAVIGVLLAAVLAWIVLAQPSAQMMTLLGLVLVIFVLQRTIGRRRM